jgi:hypothetical protein
VGTCTRHTSHEHATILFFLPKKCPINKKLKQTINEKARPRKKTIVSYRINNPKTKCWIFLPVAIEQCPWMQLKKEDDANGVFSSFSSNWL